ncbi:MAG: hypothetical protein P8129_02805 [Anaerolineae bacterium]|jgi:hypothetical protein
MKQDTARQKNRGLARFVARDPYRPTQSVEEVDELLQEMDGVVDWAFDPGGQVTVEYDPDRINDALIEDALAGVGLQLEHISDEPQAAEEERLRALAR